MNDAVKIANSIDVNTAVADFLQNNGINIGDADPQDLKYVLDSFQKRILNQISKGQVATPDDFNSKERERFEIAVEQVKNWGADVAHTGLTRHYFYKTRDALHKKTQGNTVEATVAELQNQIEIGKTVVSHVVPGQLIETTDVKIDLKNVAYTDTAVKNDTAPADIIEGLSQIKEIEEVPVTGEIKTPVLGDVAGVPDFERTENARPTKATQNEAPTVNELSGEEVSAAVIPALRSLATFEPKDNAPIAPQIKTDPRDRQSRSPIQFDKFQQAASRGEKIDRPSVFKRTLKSFSAFVTSPRVRHFASRFFAATSAATSAVTVVAILGTAMLMSPQNFSDDFKNIAKASEESVMEKVVADKNIEPEITNFDKIVIGSEDNPTTIQPVAASVTTNSVPETVDNFDFFNVDEADTIPFAVKEIAGDDTPFSTAEKKGGEVPFVMSTDETQIDVAELAEKAVSDFMTSTSDQVSAVAKQFDAYNQSKVIADIQRVDNDESYQLPSEFASLDREPVTEGAVIEVADNDTEYTLPTSYGAGDTVEFANAENLKEHRDEVQVAAAEISFTQKSVKISSFEVKAQFDYDKSMVDGFTGSVMGDSFVTDAPSVQGPYQFSNPTIQTVVNNNPTHLELKDQAAGSENAVPQFGFIEKDDTSVPVTEKSNNDGFTVPASFMADAVKTTPDDTAIITASFMADAVKTTPDDTAIITASFMADAVGEKAKDNDAITASFMEEAVSTAIPVPVNREVAQESMVDTYEKYADLDGDKVFPFKSEAKMASAEVETKNAPEMPATASGKVHSNPVTLENAEQAIQALKNSFADGAFPQSVQSQIDRIGTSTINADNFNKMRLYEAARDTMNYAQGHDSFTNVMSVFNYLAENGSGNAAKLAKDAAKKKDWVASQLNVQVNDVSFDLTNVKIIPTPKLKV